MPEDQSGQASVPSRRKSSPKTAAKIAVAKPAVERRVTDRRVADPSFKPAVERRVSPRRAADIAAAVPSKSMTKTKSKAAPVALPVPASVDPTELDIAASALAERRTTDQSLFERRLADPSAKERRNAAAAAKVKKVVKDTPAADPAAKKAEAAVSEPMPVAVEADAPPPVERRVADRRMVDVEAELRATEQQGRLGDMAVWMRKGGAALIGLNLLTVIAVAMLGRVHEAQLKEMKRATAASGAAAYAACLGTQTARNMLLEMKAERLEPRRSKPIELPPPQVALPSPQPMGAPALIGFDVEKTTDVAVHIPVLFHFKLENTGQSAALHAKVWSAVKIVNAGQEPDFKYDDVSLAKARISPGEPAAKVITYTEDGGKVAPLRDADYQRVTSGAAYVVAYGRAIYEDVYGAKHWAEFCRYITQPAAGEKRSSKCLAYNGEGASDPAAKPVVAPKPVQVQRGIQTASVNLPEIACEVPKEEKN